MDASARRQWTNLSIGSLQCRDSIIPRMGEPEEWFGWNFVDYRSSPIPDLTNALNYDLSAWPNTIPHGYGIQFENDRSWALTGVQELQERAYFKKLTIEEKGFALRRRWCFERFDH